MNLRNTRLSLGLVLTLFASLARAGSADIAGPVTYQVSGSNVTITADRLENTTTTRTTGTLYLTLRMTSGPDVSGFGYTVARKSLSYIGADLGRLPPEQSFVNISFSTAFSSPPAGSYYAHLYVSEYPNTETILDSVTFSSLATIGGGGGGGSGNSGVELIGSSNWVTDSSNGTVTLFQGQIRNTRAVATGQLTLMLRAYVNQGDDSGYTLASYDLGVLSAGAAISGVSATVAFDDPPSGSYYTAYQLIETTSSGAYLVDQADFDGVTDFGDGGGGGSVSPPMLLVLGALAAWRRKAGRCGIRKEVTPI